MPGRDTIFCAKSSTCEIAAAGTRLALKCFSQREVVLLDEVEARTQRAEQAIQAYLARHPSAADNDKGIAQWWLPCMGVDLPLADVRRALERLVAAGAMAATPLPGGSVIYRATP